MRKAKNNLSKPIVAVVIGISLLMGGCSPRLVKPYSGLDSLRNQPIHLVHYDVPPLKILTPTHAIVGAGMFGAAGAFGAKMKGEKQGDKMVEEYAIHDPSRAIQESFKGAFPVIDSEATVISHEETQKKEDYYSLKQMTNSSRVIDFKTESWRVVYFPLKWNRYRVELRTRARLIDLNQSKNLWMAFCEFQSEQSDKSPTFEELKANDGVILKKLFTEATEFCTKKLLGQFFGERNLGKIKTELVQRTVEPLPKEKVPGQKIVIDNAQEEKPEKKEESLDDTINEGKKSDSVNSEETDLAP